MAEQSGFFPDVSGDRQYTADFLAQWIASIVGNGVYNGDLAVAPGSNMQVVIPSGRAWINGYHYRNSGDLLLTIANADGILNRKDTVVLRWDVNARSITAQILQGTPASSPKAPAITRSVDQYDLKLAEISIPAGTTTITQNLITDTRLDKTVCGIVTGVVTQVDTTALYNQIQSDLAEFKNTNEAGFTTWFDGIKEILDSNAAGNLLNLISAHKADETVHVTQLSCTKTGTVYALTGLTATSGIIPCVFQAPATYAEGDTITINGTAYALHTTDGTTLTSGSWVSGANITGTVDIGSKVLTVQPSAPVGARPVTWVPTADDVGAISKQMPIVQFGTSYTAASSQAGYKFIAIGSSAITFSLPQDLASGKTFSLRILNYNPYPLPIDAGSNVFLTYGTPHTITIPPLGDVTVFSNGGGSSWGIEDNTADFAGGRMPVSIPSLRNEIISQARASSFLGVGVVNLVVE
jgi:hypothetical protein